MPVGGDAAKLVGNLGQMIAKLGDDMPAVIKLLLKTSDEHPHLVKAFGQNAIVSEAVEEALHSPNITKENWQKLVKVANEANGDLDVNRIIDIIPNQLKKYGRCDEFAECFVGALEQSGISYKIIRVDSNVAIYSDKAGKFSEWLEDLGLTQGFPGISWSYTDTIIDR